MRIKNFLKRTQFIRNNSNNCLVGSIFVHFYNVVLWSTLFMTLCIVATTPATDVKKLGGIVCIMALFVIFHSMSFDEIVLGRKKQQESSAETLQKDLTQEPSVETLQKDLTQEPSAETLQKDLTQEPSVETLQKEIEEKLKKAAAADKDDHIDLSANGF